MATRLSKHVDTLHQNQIGGLRETHFCLARFGGNEFALVLSGLSDPSDFTLVADQLRKVIANPITLKGHEFVVTASIGVATSPDHGTSVEALSKNAESARDEAKRLGSNTQKLYRSSMDSGVTECLNLENELRRALENDELSMLYQPKYCAQTLEPDGAEALLRWFHPERGEIPPSAFIPIAEESGLIIDVGYWVANNVCQQISSWEYFGVSPGTIAINISGQEFGLGAPITTLMEAVNTAGISASALELEITETVLISDIRSVMRALHALREEGFSVAVDDFGTGYSSLRYLQRFPVDVLKIDSSFVRDVERNADSRAICTAIIAMARSLGLKVVGEGVERKWQLEFLRRQACDAVQGFLLSKPLSPDDFAGLLNRGSRRTSSTDRVIQLPIREKSSPRIRNSL
jgi:EAL domain-containing protein (putative c-di-GMP-specific phosphodiesterase class I)